MFNRMFRAGLAVIGLGVFGPAGIALAHVPDDPTGNPVGTAVRAQRPTSGLPGSAKKLYKTKPQKVEDGDVWKKHPPVWSIPDATHYPHPYAAMPIVAPGGGAYPGGPSGQFGSPYYYTAYAQNPGYGADFSAAFGGGSGYGAVGFDPGVPPPVAGGVVGGGFGAGPGPYGPGYGPVPQTAALPGNLPGNPYLYHFGPGFYRYQEAGHYRFPYYSYRRPWYFPGHPSYNRDTNIPW